MQVKTYILPDYFSAAYGSCGYSTSTFNGSSNCTASTAASPNTSAQLLSNTGFAVAGIVTLVALVLLSAVLVNFVRRPGRE